MGKSYYQVTEITEMYDGLTGYEVREPYQKKAWDYYKRTSYNDLKLMEKRTDRVTKKKLTKDTITFMACNRGESNVHEIYWIIEPTLRKLRLAALIFYHDIWRIFLPKLNISTRTVKKLYDLSGGTVDIYDSYMKTAGSMSFGLQIRSQMMFPEMYFRIGEYMMETGRMDCETVPNDGQPHKLIMTHSGIRRRCFRKIFMTPEIISSFPKTYITHLEYSQHKDIYTDRETVRYHESFGHISGMVYSDLIFIF